jgi:Peptidase family M28
MKKLLICSAFLFFTFTNCQAQKIEKLPEYQLSKADAESQIRFLASDEMLGRRTGSITNRVAARYLAESFRNLGLKPAEGQKDFLQPVGLDLVKSVKQGRIIGGVDTLSVGKHFVVFGGFETTSIENKEVVFVGYGWKDDAKNYDDYKDLDVTGKVVISQIGTPDSKSPNEMFSAANKKRKIAQEKGAIGLIEIFAAPVPWITVAGYFNGESIALNDSKDSPKRLPHFWVNAQTAKGFKKDLLKTISINVSSRERSPMRSYNVVGVLEGSDPVLKKEYVVLSAHYDHVGVGKEGGNAYKEDSIFNGTRDNAFGTVAVLQAAKALSISKPKRSILFIGYTGEEVGLLGSKYYAENPLVPLKDCVYNLNCDGAGYNDTTKITVIGLSRTDVKSEIEKAAQAFGLSAMDDPAPEQGLFDRSDNVSLAIKGIPSPTYSPGFVKFDEGLFKYYHQAADNPDTVSMDYLLKYCQAYSYAARLIANRPVRPKWVSGDKYEKAFNELFSGK